MNENQSILADFLNHGTLPFVGREHLIENVESFIAETIDASSLRSLLLVGEAGIGKTALTENIVRHAEKNGILVIHARLRPASSTSPVMLLSDAIRNSHSPRSLKRMRGETSFEEVVDLLRRLCRLRLTLIIIEDIHLLEGSTLDDFSNLLTAFSEDPIALLCSTRPQNESAMNLLETSLVERIEVEGLSLEQMQNLGDALFGEAKDPHAIEALTEVTLGNPLAIRGALRGALRQETIQRDSSGRWTVDDRFLQVIRVGAESISDGLASHLEPEERYAAEQLACLGEIFARKTALFLLGHDAQPLINQLLFKGILVRSLTTTTSLTNNSDKRQHLLAFTHSLVHHTLFEASVPQVQKIAELILHHLPLYSILPVEILSDSRETINSIESQLEPLAKWITDVSGRLINTSDWHLALRLVEPMLRAISQSDINPNKKILLELDLIDAKLHILESNVYTEEYKQTIHLYCKRIEEALKEDYTAQHLLQHKFNSLVHQYKHLSEEYETPQVKRLEREIEELISTHTDLLHSGSYARFLTWKAERVAIRSSWKEQEEFEKYLEEFIANPETPEMMRSIAQPLLSTYFLSLVRTPEEYQKRLRNIEEADQEDHRGDLTEISWILMKARFYGFTGHFKRQWELYTIALPLAENRGRVTAAQSLKESIVKCSVAFGLSPQQAEDRLLKLGGLQSTESRPADMIVVNNLTAIALLRGETEWGLDFYDRYVIPNWSNPTILPLLIALLRDNPAKAWQNTSTHTVVADVYEAISKALASSASQEDLTDFTQFLEDAVEIEPIAMRHILILHLALRLLKLCSDTIPASKELMRKGVRKGISWSEERELWTFMETLINRFGKVLPTAERLQVLEKSKNLQATTAHQFEPAVVAGKQFHISMFGTISVQTSVNDEPIRIRGERLKTLLSTMIANEIVGRPLSRDEFLRVASGQDGTSRKARDVVNKTVSRLRESVGKELILTDEVIPRVNTEVLTVDLLQAYDALHHAHTSLQQGNLVKGVNAIETCLSLWKGEVPFPTLYDELFETLREEFEAAVRTTGLEIAEELLRLGDPVSTTTLLKRLTSYIPEDDELLELYIEALEASGNKTEALRLRS